MINQMRDETVQFQEEQLVLQEGAALESGVDVLLVGIEQGGIKINSEKVEDQKLQVNKGSENIYQVGKRKFKEWEDSKW